VKGTFPAISQQLNITICGVSTIKTARYHGNILTEKKNFILPKTRHEKG
jgi:hypothetical protein